MHIIEFNTFSYMGCLFFIYCFFSYTPALHFCKKELVKYYRKLENDAYYIVYGKMLEDVTESETPVPVPVSIFSENTLSNITLWLLFRLFFMSKIFLCDLCAFDFIVSPVCGIYPYLCII